MTGPAPAGHLRTLLTRRVREVVDRVGAGEEPTKEEVDSLDRLSRLVNMEQSVLRAQQRRLAGLLLLGLAIIAATLVLTIRVWWDGDIAVDAEVTALSFVPAEPTWLVAGPTGAERVRWISVPSGTVMRSAPPSSAGFV